MSGQIQGTGIGRSVSAGTLLWASDLAGSRTDGPIVLVYAGRSTNELLKLLERSDVVAVIVGPTGSYSHLAWAVEFNDLPGVSLDVAQLANAVGKWCIVDGDSGSIRIDADDGAAIFNERAGVRSSNRPETETEVAVRSQIVGPSDVAFAASAGAAGVGEVKAEVSAAPGSSNASLLAIADENWTDVPYRFFDYTLDKDPVRSHGIEPSSPLGLRGVRMLTVDRRYDLLEHFIAGIPIAMRSTVVGVLPMVTDAAEVVEVREAVGGRIGGVGALIETPAAVRQATSIAAESDLLMIGLSDLTQYSFGWDRGLPSDRVMPRSMLHSVVVEQAVEVASAARANGVPVSLPLDLAPTPELAEQVVRIKPSYIAVPPRRIVDWKVELGLLEASEREIRSLR